MLLKHALPVALLSLGLVPFSALSVRADEHVVIILGSTYFPQKTTVEQGDVVRFVNRSGTGHTVLHAQGVWVTPQIAAGKELLVTIEPGMTGAFYGVTSKEISGQLTLRESNATD